MPRSYNQFVNLLFYGNTINIDHDEHDIDLESVSVLIPKSRNGDEVAREQLLSEIQSFLEMVARQNLHSDLRQKVGASDVVQMAFLRVVENFDKFNGDTRNEFHGWLKAIVINEIRNTKRMYSAEKRDYRKEQGMDGPPEKKTIPIPPDSSWTPSTKTIAAERIARLYSVLEELTPEHAMVIRLRSIQELSFKEIGDRMNRSEDAVSKLWYRAMLKLEEKLQLMGDFESQ